MEINGIPRQIESELHIRILKTLTTRFDAAEAA